MASTITRFALTHPITASQFKNLLGLDIVSTPDPDVLLAGLETLLGGLNTGARTGGPLLMSVSEGNGVKASATVTISSGSGVVGCYVNGKRISVTWATSDTATGTALKSAINADPDAKRFVLATDSSGVVTLTAVAADASGNDITLTAFGTGTTASAATLGGAVASAASGTLTISSGSGSVGGTIGGTSVTVTWATSDTASAAALATAIKANSTVNKWVTASSNAGVVTITCLEKTVIGNNITLVASGTGVTASGARLTGGTSPAYVSFTLNG